METRVLGQFDDWQSAMRLFEEAASVFDCDYYIVAGDIDDLAVAPFTVLEYNTDSEWMYPDGTRYTTGGHVGVCIRDANDRSFANAGIKIEGCLIS